MMSMVLFFFKLWKLHKKHNEKATKLKELGIENINNLCVYRNTEKQILEYNFSVHLYFEIAAYLMVLLIYLW